MKAQEQNEIINDTLDARGESASLRCGEGDLFLFPEPVSVSDNSEERWSTHLHRRPWT